MCDLEQWIKDHCWSNADFIHGEIRAVAVWFCGLGSGFRNSASDMDLALAESGVLVISPYYGPWSWMNRLARQLVDELLEKVFEFYQLKDDTPLISSGWSMGGLASLLYCRYGKRRPAGCCVLFPVCDLPFHFREREDVPPTVCYAFYG